MNIISALLEVTVRCLNCGDVIAVNACVNDLYCPSCSGKTNISNKTWSLLLKEIFSEAKGMHIGEARRTVLDDDKTGTIRITMRRTQIDPETFESSSNREFPNAISSGLSGVFLNEDSFQIAESEQKSEFSESIKIDCASCGGTIETDGKKRAVICSYCNTNNLISDEIWHRLHPSDNIRPWVISFNSDETTTLKPWNYGSVSSVCSDNNILFCVGQSNNNEYALWAMSDKGALIWMSLIRKDKRWKDDYFSNIILLSDDRLLICNEFVHCGLTYDSKTGDFIGELGGLEPYKAKKHHFDLYFCESLAADPDGSMLVLMNQRILRYSKDGIGIPTWPKGSKNLDSLYKKRDKNSEEISVYNKRVGKLVLPRKIKNYSSVYPAFSSTNPTVEIDSEGSVYILVPVQTNVKRQITGGALLTKFNKSGKIIYKADLIIYCTEKIFARIDSQNYAYVLMTDSKVEFEDMGRIMRISPDGKEIKTIVKANYRIINPTDYVFSVSSDGNIHITGNDGVLRMYNRDGELLWRSESAVDLDKKIYNSMD